MTEDGKLVPLERIATSENAAKEKSEPDSSDQKEKELNERRLRAEIGQLEEQNADKKAARELRFQYAMLVYRYLVSYSAAVVAMLVASALQLGGFHLPETVLLAVTGTTAAAAIGLVGFVVTGLFKNSV